MIAFILAGLVLGGIYAISAASIVVTYVSAGVLNFAFGAIAFFIARLYYYLVAQHGWPVYAAAIVAIVIAGPLLGVALYFALFRFLARPRRSPRWSRPSGSPWPSRPRPSSSSETRRS